MEFSGINVSKKQSKKNKLQIIMNDQITIFKTAVTYALIPLEALSIVNLRFRTHKWSGLNKVFPTF